MIKYKGHTYKVAASEARKIEKWMWDELNANPDEYYDSAGEPKYTHLAEQAAWALDDTDTWLDDESHTVWDLAVDVLDAFTADREKLGRAPAMQLTQQQYLRQPRRQERQERRKKNRDDSKVRQFFKKLFNFPAESDQAEATWGERVSQWGRIRQAQEQFVVPGKCVVDILGMGCSTDQNVTFEKKGGDWVINGVPSNGVVVDELAHYIQQACSVREAKMEKKAVQIAKQSFTINTSNDIIAAANAKKGKWVQFEVHDKQFKIKCKTTGVYVLGEEGRTRYRWGDTKQIKEDIDFVLEYGTLPPPEKGSQASLILDDHSYTKQAAEQPILPETYEEVLTYEKRGPGKFSDSVEEKVYEWTLDGGGEALGDVEGFGYYELVVIPGGVLVRGNAADPDEEWYFQAAIMSENNQGFVNVQYYDTIEEAEADWAKLEAEYDEWLDEVAAENPGWEPGDY